jgi:hypothetical protein
LNNCRETVDQDLVVEAAVLRHVGLEHPTPIARIDLRRELAETGGARFTPLEVDVAVDTLVRVGLLYRQEEIVLPARPALYFFDLLGAGEW